MATTRSETQHGAAGLSVLVRAQVLARCRGIRLVVVTGRKRCVRRAFALTQLDSEIEVVDSVPVDAWYLNGYLSSSEWWSTRFRASSTSLTLIFCEVWRSRVNAASSLMRWRCIRMPLAWPMTSRVSIA